VASYLFFSFVPFGLGMNELTLTVLLGPFVPAGEAFFVALLVRALGTICELGFALIGALLSLPYFIKADPTGMVTEESFSHQNEEKPEGLSDAKALLPPK
jgi:hypothetical protein